MTRTARMQATPSLIYRFFLTSRIYGRFVCFFFVSHGVMLIVFGSVLQEEKMKHDPIKIVNALTLNICDIISFYLIWFT